MINLSQNDYNILKQPFMTRYLKLDILNFKYQVVDEISGNCTNCSVSVDANSDLRRSCSATLVVTDSTFDIQAGGKIWLDKFIRPRVGIENIYTGEIQWYSQGIYLINAPSWKYDATTNELSFQGLDLMSKLTGIRNGYLEGIPTVIPQGSNVRESMIATLALGGFTEYVISECKNKDNTVQEVPYDIKIEQGGTIYDVLSKLRDILPQYQIYFDINGVFHYDLIPSGDDAPTLLTDDLWDNVLLNEQINTDFEGVKNYIEVYGRSHDVEHYSSSTTVSNNVVNLTIASLTAPTEYIIIGFTPLVAVSGNIQLNLNNTTAQNLVDSNGNYITSLDKDVYYCASYQANGTWLFLGHQQAQAIWYDNNPSSPFYYLGSVGKIRTVLYGNDYDNIPSDELALQRAKLEIYWKCRLNDSITLNVIPIPWMDVNFVVSHAPKNGTIENKYMVQSYNVDYGTEGTMTINMSSYYPYYNPLTE